MRSRCRVGAPGGAGAVAVAVAAAVAAGIVAGAPRVARAATPGVVVQYGEIVVMEGDAEVVAGALAAAYD